MRYVDRKGIWYTTLGDSLCKTSFSEDMADEDVLSSDVDELEADLFIAS